MPLCRTGIHCGGTWNHRDKIVRYCDWSVENYEETWNLSGGIKDQHDGIIGHCNGTEEH